MDMPSSVGIGFIEGRWIAAGLDNLDVGLRPQAVQIDSLRVSIVPTSPQIRLTLPVGPTMVHLPEIVLVTNQAGEVINPKTGESTVAVIATDNPGADFRYIVTVTADGMDPIRAQIQVPANQVVDLADLAAWPVPLPEETAAWEAALSSFQVYRDQVVAASDAITVALDGQDLTVVAGWAADTQAAKDQVLAAKASLDASIAGLDIPTLEGLRDDIQLSVITNQGYSQSAATSATDASAAQIAAEEARDEAVQAATGGVIDDDATSLDFTWSSDKISTGLGVKSDHGHTHQQADVDGLTDALDARPLMTAVTALLAGKSDTSHSHAIENVTGLQGSLDATITEARLGKLDARLAAVFREGRTVVVLAGSSTTWMNVWPVAFAGRVGAMFRPVTHHTLSGVGTLGDGIHFVNAGLNGKTAADYLTASTRTQISGLNPRVMFHMVGSNDWALSHAPSTFKTNLSSQIGQITSTEPLLHVIVHQHERTNVTANSYQWDEYRQAAREVAELAPNRIFVDASEPMRVAGVGKGLDNAYGLLSGDRVHLTDPGARVLGDVIADRLGISEGSVGAAYGWTDISPYLDSGFSGTVSAKRTADGMVTIAGFGLLGTFAGSSVTTDILTDIPAQFRPTRTQFWGSAWGGAGAARAGVATVRPDGTLGVVFDVAQSAAQFTINYPAD